MISKQVQAHKDKQKEYLNLDKTYSIARDKAMINLNRRRIDCHKQNLIIFKEYLEEEFLYFYGEIKYIQWARNNGMPNTIYDDYKGNFNRKQKQVKEDLDQITKMIAEYDA